MPVFRYQAIDKRGRNLKGIMPAHDESNLEEKLRQLGLWLAEADMERAAAATESARPSEVRWYRTRGARGRRELIDFCTLMTFQIRVGVPLSRALETAALDCKEPGFSKVLGALQGDIESGLHFYEAIAKYPAVFSQHFVSVIRAGETSSKLPETFDDLKAYLEWVDQINADIKQATLYPSIVLFVIMFFTIFLFTFIIPTFSKLLGKLGVEQPLLTTIVFTAGDIFKNTWYIWLPLMIAIAIAIPILKRRSPKFAMAWDKMKLHLPVFGELNRMLALSKFAHNLSILYRSGISILQALAMCQRGLIGNKVIETAVGHVEEEVKNGNTISEAMHRQQGAFSAMLLRMVNMGEATGNLDKALDNVAAFYNDIIPRKIKKVFAIMEPALMLALIFIVGSVALAIYLPIIALMGAIK